MYNNSNNNNLKDGGKYAGKGEQRKVAVVTGGRWFERPC